MASPDITLLNEKIKKEEGKEIIAENRAKDSKKERKEDTCGTVATLPPADVEIPIHAT